jgi:hypothetical protein
VNESCSLSKGGLIRLESAGGVAILRNVGLLSGDGRAEMANFPREEYSDLRFVVDCGFSSDSWLFRFHLIESTELDDLLRPKELSGEMGMVFIESIRHANCPLFLFLGVHELLLPGVIAQNRC